MTYDPPFVPEDREHDESMQDRVARARELREKAEARVEQRYAGVKQREGRWHSGDCHDLEMERLSVL